MAEVTRPTAQPRLPEAAMPWAKEVNKALDQLMGRVRTADSNVDRAYSAATGAASAALGAASRVEQVSDSVTTAPGIPAYVSASSVAYWDERGLPRARISVVWDQVTDFYNGDPLGATAPVSLYQVWAFPNDSTKAQLLGAFSPESQADAIDPDPGAITPPPPLTLQIEGLNTGTQYQLSVRARTLQGVWGEYSPTFPHTTATMTEVPAAPTPPVADSSPGVILLTWDGKLVVGGVPTAAPNTLAYVYSVFSTTQAGTYAPTGNTIPRAETIGVAGLVVGETYWFKFGAVNNAGIAGPFSTPISATVQGVDLLDLNPSVQDAIDEALLMGQSAQATADGRNTIFTSIDEPLVGSTVFTNRVSNPSFEVSNSGWDITSIVVGGTNPVRDNTRSLVGTYSGRLDRSLNGINLAFGKYMTTGIKLPVSEGEVLNAGFSMYPTFSASGPGPVAPQYLTYFLDDASNVKASGAAGFYDLKASEWNDIKFNITVPTSLGITNMLLVSLIPVSFVPVGGSAWLDKVYVGTPEYVDGDLPATEEFSYLWDGTSGLSSSRKAAALRQGDLWWQLGTGVDAGSIINVNMYNGTVWVPYLLVADEILVPGSVGNVTIRDGAVSASKVLAEEAFFDKVFGSEFMGQRIKVDQVEPNFGTTLNIGGNAVAINLSGRADQAVIDNTQTRQDLAGTQADADAAAAAAEAASQAVNSLAGGRVLTAENAIGILSGKIDEYDNSFLFLPDGLHIREAEGAVAEMILTSAGARLMADGYKASEWNQGALTVDQIFVNGGQIGNHVIDKSIAGHTTYRLKIEG